MKTFKYISILLVVAITGIVTYFSLQDGNYNITETKSINATQELIYNQISDFKNWINWNPWLQDKGVTNKMGHSTTGSGGSYSFTDEFGKGSMTITKAIENEFVSFDMNYVHSLGSSNAVVSMDIIPAENGSKVKWTLKGEATLMEKITNFFLGRDIEKEIRPKYKQGLKNLEDYIVKSMDVYNVEIMGIQTIKESYYLNIQTMASMEKYPMALAEQKQRLLQYMNQNHLVMTGKPTVFYDKIDYDYKSVTFRVAVPVPICPNQDAANPEITCSYKPESDDVVVLLNGSYKYLANAWEQAERFVIDENLKKSGLIPYEIYLNDAAIVKNPAQFKTEIHIPINKIVTYE